MELRNEQLKDDLERPERLEGKQASPITEPFLTTPADIQCPVRSITIVDEENTVKLGERLFMIMTCQLDCNWGILRQAHGIISLALLPTRQD